MKNMKDGGAAKLKVEKVEPSLHGGVLVPAGGVDMNGSLAEGVKQLGDGRFLPPGATGVHALAVSSDSPPMAPLGTKKRNANVRSPLKENPRTKRARETMMMNVRIFLLPIRIINRLFFFRNQLSSDVVPFPTRSAPSIMEVDTVPAVGLIVQIPGGDAHSHIMDVDAPTTAEGSTLHVPGEDARARSPSLSMPLGALRLQESTGLLPDVLVEENVDNTPQPKASDMDSVTINNTSQLSASNSVVGSQDVPTTNKLIPTSPLLATSQSVTLKEPTSDSIIVPKPPAQRQSKTVVSGEGMS